MVVLPRLIMPWPFIDGRARAADLCMMEKQTQKVK